MVEEDFADTITPEDNKVPVYGEQLGYDHTKNNEENRFSGYVGNQRVIQAR